MGRSPSLNLYFGSSADGEEGGKVGPKETGKRNVFPNLVSLVDALLLPKAESHNFACFLAVVPSDLACSFYMRPLLLPLTFAPKLWLLLLPEPTEKNRRIAARLDIAATSLSGFFAFGNRCNYNPPNGRNAAAVRWVIHFPAFQSNLSQICAPSAAFSLVWVSRITAECFFYHIFCI